MSKVIVITGASSGMGRAAALRFAARGDKVVLAARRPLALEALARDCGEHALAAPTDITDEAAVEELAQQAVAQFGRIDAWVNTAAVSSFGKFWETPIATMRRVVETDLVGSMIVARVAMRQFFAQYEGTLVLVSSALGNAPIPYLGAYNAAKLGVAGLATSIRADLKEEGSIAEHIRVVNLMPPSTDTPLYAHAANYVGRAPRPPPPAYDIDTLAEAIVDAVDDPRDDITPGAAGKLMRAARAGIYESLTGPYSLSMFSEEDAPRTHGNVFEPAPEGLPANPVKWS